MFLNTRQPPFDDIRVRQAVNFATDRAALVERVGGPEVAARRARPSPPRSPASRLLPLHRRSSGWRLDRSRSLARASPIAESGTAGAKVVVEIPVGSALSVPTSCHCCATSGSGRERTCSASTTTSRTSTGLARACRWAGGLGRRLHDPVDLHRAPVRLRNTRRSARLQRLPPLLRGVMTAIRRAQSKPPRRRTRRRGRSRIAASSTSRRGPVRRWPHGGVCLEAGRQRRATSAVGDAAGPNVGSLSLDSLRAATGLGALVSRACESRVFALRKRLT